MARCLGVLLLPCLMFAAGAAHAEGPSILASHIWIRQAPPGVEVMVGYMTLTNQTSQALALDKVTSPNFGEVALHRTLRQNGMDSMQPVKSLVLPAHASVVLAPGGYHLMLMHPLKPLYDGDLVTLSLMFSDRSSLTIMAPVRRDTPPS
jgi:copper(I)-binding protein